MLVSKKYEAEKIVSFKILNGDEIVARLVSDDAASFTIIQPLAIVPSQNGLALVPALFSTDPRQTIVLSKNHVMLHGETSDDLVDAYKSKSKIMVDSYVQRTTGIQTIHNSSIIV